MGKAKPENCSHPADKRARTAYGHYKCERCDLDTTPSERRFTVHHSPRVTLSQCDRVAVNGGHHSGAFQGVFHWAETFESGEHYLVAEMQRYVEGGKTYEAVAAWRWVKPEYVRQAPGVRDRRRREEQ